MILCSSSFAISDGDTKGRGWRIWRRREIISEMASCYNWMTTLIRTLMSRWCNMHLLLPFNTFRRVLLMFIHILVAWAILWRIHLYVFQVMIRRFWASWRTGTRKIGRRNYITRSYIWRLLYVLFFNQKHLLLWIGLLFFLDLLWSIRFISLMSPNSLLSINKLIIYCRLSQDFWLIVFSKYRKTGQLRGILSRCM